MMLYKEIKPEKSGIYRKKTASSGKRRQKAVTLLTGILNRFFKKAQKSDFFIKKRFKSLSIRIVFLTYFALCFYAFHNDGSFFLTRGDIVLT